MIAPSESPEGRPITDLLSLLDAKAGTVLEHEEVELGAARVHPDGAHEGGQRIEEPKVRLETARRGLVDLAAVKEGGRPPRSQCSCCIAAPTSTRLNPLIATVSRRPASDSEGWAGSPARRYPG